MLNYRQPYAISTSSDEADYTYLADGTKVKADMITTDYKWIKGNGHTNYEAAYAAHIIHLTVRSIPQNAIGNLFGIKSISTYLGRLDTKESIKKPIEDIFRTAGLKINTK